MTQDSRGQDKEHGGEGAPHQDGADPAVRQALAPGQVWPSSMSRGRNQAIAHTSGGDVDAVLLGLAGEVDERRGHREETRPRRHQARGGRAFRGEAPEQQHA